MSKATKKISIPNVDGLTEIYGISNTPSYLYRQFRRNDAIFTIGTEYNARILAKEIRRVLALSMPTPEDNVAAIASAIALELRPITEMREALALLPGQLPKWLQQIISMVKQSKIADSEISIQLAYSKPTVHLQSATAANIFVEEKAK